MVVEEGEGVSIRLELMYLPQNNTLAIAFLHPAVINDVLVGTQLGVRISASDVEDPNFDESDEFDSNIRGSLEKEEIYGPAICSR